MTYRLGDIVKTAEVCAGLYGVQRVVDLLQAIDEKFRGELGIQLKLVSQPFFHRYRALPEEIKENLGFLPEEKVNEFKINYPKTTQHFQSRNL